MSSTTCHCLSSSGVIRGLTSCMALTNRTMTSPPPITPQSRIGNLVSSIFTTFFSSCTAIVVVPDLFKDLLLENHKALAIGVIDSIDGGLESKYVKSSKIFFSKSASILSSHLFIGLRSILPKGKNRSRGNRMMRRWRRL